MKTQHTQGKWELQRLQTTRGGDMSKLRDTNTFSIGTKKRSICLVNLNQIQRLSEEFQQENEANAKLIAAAPELLEALNDAHNLLREITGKHEWVDVKSAAFEAIKKATE